VKIFLDVSSITNLHLRKRKDHKLLTRHYSYPNFLNNFVIVGSFQIGSWNAYDTTTLKFWVLS
jgi:hypothetical protein